MSYATVDITNDSGVNELVDYMALLPLALSGWTLHDHVAGSFAVWASPVGWPSFYLAFEYAGYFQPTANCYVNMYDTWNATIHTGGTLLHSLSGADGVDNLYYEWGDTNTYGEWYGDTLHVAQSSEHLFIGLELTTGWSHFLLFDKYTVHSAITSTITYPWFAGSTSNDGLEDGWIAETISGTKRAFACSLTVLSEWSGQPTTMRLGGPTSGTYASFEFYVVAGELLYGTLNNTKLVPMGVSDILAFTSGGRNWLLWPGPVAGTVSHGIFQGNNDPKFSYAIAVAY